MSRTRGIGVTSRGSQCPGIYKLQHGLQDSQNHLSRPFRAGEVYARVDSGIGSPYQKGGGAAAGSTEETE